MGKCGTRSESAAKTTKTAKAEPKQSRCGGGKTKAEPKKK